MSLVRCIDEGPNVSLTVGSIYEVLDAGETWYDIRNDKGNVVGYDRDLFEPIKEKPLSLDNNLLGGFHDIRNGFRSPDVTTIRWCNNETYDLKKDGSSVTIPKIGLVDKDELKRFRMALDQAEMLGWFKDV